MKGAEVDDSQYGLGRIVKNCSVHSYWQAAHTKRTGAGFIHLGPHSS